MSTLASEFNQIYTTISAYYLPVIFVIGVFGNLANIIIFSRGNLRKNVSSWYFICLSIAQIILLFVSGLYRIISTGWSNGYDASRTSTNLCKLRMYWFVFSIAVSRHFLCLISLDRWMKTSRSATIRKKSSPKYGRWLIAFSFIFWIIFELHVPIGYPDTSLVGGCTVILNSPYSLFYSIYNIVDGIVPAVFMILCSLLIQNNLRKQGRIVHPAAVAAQATSNNQLSRQHKTDFELIRLSLIQIIFFLVSNITVILFPLYAFMTSSQTKSANQRAIESFIGLMGQYLLITYAASTFGLYTLASSTFRQETKNCFQMIIRKYIRALNNL